MARQYRYEGVSPVGSHKANTAIAQAFYNRDEGVQRITTETGRPTNTRCWLGVKRDR